MTWCNSPHSTYHSNPCQPLKTVPPLPSSASLPHSHAEPKEWGGGLSPPCPSICWVVSLPNMQSSPTRSDIAFFIGDPHKPSFATSWEGGPSKSYLLCVSRLPFFSLCSRRVAWISYHPCVEFFFRQSLLETSFKRLPPLDCWKTIHCNDPLVSACIHEKKLATEYSREVLQLAPWKMILGRLLCFWWW